MLENDAKITFLPIQEISAIPDTASHSASIAQYNAPQIEYLHQSGLTDAEVKKALRDAFMNDIDIFE